MPEMELLAAGDWTRGGVRVVWVPSGFRPPQPVQDAIDRTWTAEKTRLGDRLFDGPLCRLERWRTLDGHLELELSRTSYKPYLGTNGRNRELAAAHGPSALANPVGNSAAVLSSDGLLLFGIRGANLALYPGCAHPIGGCMEPAEDLDVLADMERELAEEVGLAGADLIDLRCIALGMDGLLAQPELVFAARSRLTFAELASRVDAEEHRGSWSVPADPRSVADALRDQRPVTPLTRLTLLAYGRWAFGAEWLRAIDPNASNSAG